VTSSTAAASLKRSPDPAIMRLVRALARAAAREDHERMLAERKDTSSGTEREP